MRSVPEGFERSLRAPRPAWAFRQNPLPPDPRANRRPLHSRLHGGAKGHRPRRQESPVGLSGRRESVRTRAGPDHRRVRDQDTAGCALRDDWLRPQSEGSAYVLRKPATPYAVYALRSFAERNFVARVHWKRVLKEASNECRTSGANGENSHHSRVHGGTPHVAGDDNDHSRHRR